MLLSRIALAACVVATIVSLHAVPADAAKGPKKKAQTKREKEGAEGGAAAARAAKRARSSVQRSPKQWNRMTSKDIEELEKEWEEGDDPDLLKTEDQLLFEEMERRRKQPPKMNPGCANCLPGFAHRRCMTRHWGRALQQSEGLHGSGHAEPGGFAAVHDVCHADGK